MRAAATVLALAIAVSSATAGACEKNMTFTRAAYTAPTWALGELSPAGKANVLAWERQTAGPATVRYLESLAPDRRWIVAYQRAGRLGNGPESAGWIGVLEAGNDTCLAFREGPILTRTILQIVQGNW